MSGVITPTIENDGEVTVDMGAPRFMPSDIPFDARGLTARRQGDESLWSLTIDDTSIDIAVVSMGNPHAVTIVDDIELAPVATLGPRIEQHPRFAKRVNAGFVQIVDRRTVSLRVYERGAGETLACGTGACAAVVSGIRRGLLDASVAVHARGGVLTIDWDGDGTPVRMRGPARAVFEGEVVIPDVDQLRGYPVDREGEAASRSVPSSPSSVLHQEPSTLEPQPS